MDLDETFAAVRDVVMANGSECQDGSYMARLEGRGAMPEVISLSQPTSRLKRSIIADGRKIAVVDFTGSASIPDQDISIGQNISPTWARIVLNAVAHQAINKPESFTPFFR